jgi:nucleoid DNA-binding protein
MAVNIKEVSKMAGLSPVVCTCGRKIDVLNSVVEMFESMLQLVSEGKTVRIKNFGSFFMRVLEGRKIKSPVLAGGQAQSDTVAVLGFRQSQNAKVKLTKKLNEAKPKKKKAAKRKRRK